MRFFFIFLFPVLLFGQTTATFEEFNLNVGQFLNQSNPSGVFSSGNVLLPINYNSQFDFWDGWSISAVNDATTPGFPNQYAAAAGSGQGGSTAYSTAYTNGNLVMRLQGAALGGTVAGLWVTNSTYTYYSMLDGDAFAKKFGGESGNDPDFFKLVVRKYQNDVLAPDSVEFYLADYRFANNASDYIVKTWNWVDLRSLGKADSLAFFLSSSDNGVFGMNTPAYFCVDNVQTLDDGFVSVESLDKVQSFGVFPNPASDVVQINREEAKSGLLRVFSATGGLIGNHLLTENQHAISITDLPNGVYYLEFSSLGLADKAIRRLVVQR